jgi:zinc protease
VAQAFGPVSGPPAPSRRAATEPPQLGEHRITVNKDAQLPAVILGYHVPNYRHPDSYALTVLAALLTQGESSRLHRALVYDREVALDVGGDYTALSADPPIFYVYGMTHAGKSAADLERALTEELDRITTAEPTERELTKVKNGIEAEFILGQDSNFYRAMQVGTAEAVGAGRGYLDDFVANIRKVSAADVARVAKAYLNQNNRTVGILNPLRSEEPAAAGAP